MSPLLSQNIEVIAYSVWPRASNPLMIPPLQQHFGRSRVHAARATAYGKRPVRFGGLAGSQSRTFGFADGTRCRSERARDQISPAARQRAEFEDRHLRWVSTQIWMSVGSTLRPIHGNFAASLRADARTWKSRARNVRTPSRPALFLSRHVYRVLFASRSIARSVHVQFCNFEKSVSSSSVR